MTNEEVKGILSTFKAAFPNAFKNMGREEGNAILSLWCRELEAEGINKVRSAVSALISEKPATWVPSIGDVKREIEKQFPQGTWALNRRPYPQSFIDTVHKFLAEEEAAGRYKPERPPQ